MAVVNVCAWCHREILEGNEPGQKYAPGCIPANASHGCCKVCQVSVDTEIKAYLLEERENEKLKQGQPTIG